MPTIVRILAAVVLLVVTAGCAFQALAAGEMPEAAWIYRLIDAVIGVPCLLGAGFLLRPRRRQSSP